MFKGNIEGMDQRNIFLIFKLTENAYAEIVG